MKKKYSAFYLGTLLLLSFSVVKAQEAYEPGYVILNDGSRVSGLILLNTIEPWLNQRSILLKDSAAVAANPNKQVAAKKYRFDDMKSYQVGNRKFEKVNYMDMEKLQVKNLGSNEHMLEKLSDGRINAYRYYAYPKDVYAGFDVDEQIQKDKDDSIRGWKLLAKKDDDDKFRDAFNVDLQKYFEDTPSVLQKYKNGEYGNEPISNKKGLGAKMKALAWRSSELMHLQSESIIKAINDYNKVNASNK